MKMVVAAPSQSRRAKKNSTKKMAKENQAEVTSPTVGLTNVVLPPETVVAAGVPSTFPSAVTQPNIAVETIQSVVQRFAGAGQRQQQQLQQQSEDTASHIQQLLQLVISSNQQATTATPSLAQGLNSSISLQRPSFDPASICRSLLNQRIGNLQEPASNSPTLQQQVYFAAAQQRQQQQQQVILELLKSLNRNS